MLQVAGDVRVDIPHAARTEHTHTRTHTHTVTHSQTTDTQHTAHTQHTHTHIISTHTLFTIYHSSLLFTLLLLTHSLTHSISTSTSQCHQLPAPKHPYYRYTSTTIFHKTVTSTRTRSLSITSVSLLQQMEYCSCFWILRWKFSMWFPLELTI